MCPVCHAHHVMERRGRASGRQGGVRGGREGERARVRGWTCFCNLGRVSAWTPFQPVGFGSLSAPPRFLIDAPWVTFHAHGTGHGVGLGSASLHRASCLQGCSWLQPPSDSPLPAAEHSRFVGIPHLPLISSLTGGCWGVPMSAGHEQCCHRTQTCVPARPTDFWATGHLCGHIPRNPSEQPHR